MKLKLYLIIFGLLTTSLFSGENQYYQIQSQTASGLTIAFHFDELNVIDISDDMPYLKSFEIPNLGLNYENGEPLLPILSLPIVLPEGKYTVHASIEQATTFDNVYPQVFEDISSASESLSNSGRNFQVDAFMEKFPEQFYELKDMGLFRDYRIATLRIYPVQVTGSGVRFYEKFKISISFPESQALSFRVQPGEAELLKKVVVNKAQASLVAPTPQSQQQPTYSPLENTNYDSRVRLIVIEDGIYQVTASDLINAGVDIGGIVPSSFRLTNKGKEIAVYLAGDEDNSFDPGDYIEFWGEGNRETFIDQYPDLYSDPFSDENVYWLEWGGSPGLRMVEENGSIITNNPTEYNPSTFYTTKVHVETNNRFERLGYANLDRLSHTRDLWFWGPDVKAVGRRQYPFELVYPDSTSNLTPVFVDIMLHGLSTAGGHDVVAWLNDDIVGNSPPGWVGQDTARITNRPNSLMRSIDLAHGTNMLEIQLPTLPQSGTDIVLLNWFEVSYDRQYRAHNNYIEFTRPSLIYFSNINLYQFDIARFTRPDIEIYKKDISKIVNFNLESEVANNQNFYHISFQDHILSDDVEYVALTSNRKKKPLRIERDEPFDPENPQRFLKDAANSAEYLIITHSRLYNTALPLLDYRRNQGLDVEMVNVQDIYDEFNHGIKSPLAIKSFLNYVYRNWNQNRRLKYVLFLGDANFNYKITQGVNADLVPTFFYQSIEFGAVATDFPYSLISGSDLIPDLFVGRIPASTNSDVIVAVNKIIEYEQNAAPGQWKNQALFISGNDASTNDRLDNNQPIFRTQSSRVIKNQIPPHASSFRLHTVQDTSLHPDPNFGSTTDLINYFDEGAFMVNFLGHGGGGVWADISLLTIGDVNRLNNQGKYPFITSMTCFTGAFDNPGEYGLAQKFVLTANRGGIGVLASSGLGWAYNDFAMLWATGQFLFDPSLTVGEAVTLGKILYLSSRSGYYVNGRLLPTPQHQSGNYLGDDMVHQYNLIGDPYIAIARTPPHLNVMLNTNNPQAEDTLQVTIQSPIAPAEGYVEIADKNNQIVTRLPVFTSDFTTTLNLTIPASYPEGTGIVRAYLSDGTEDASGFKRIGVNYAAIDSITIIPPNPDADDSVHVRFKVSDAQGIQRVYLLEQNNLSDTLFAQEVAPGVYQTIQPFAPLFKVGTVFYSIYVENTAGNRSVFRNQKYQVFDPRPDVFAYSNSISFGGRERVQIQVHLGNQGGSAAQNTPVHFYDGYNNFINRVPFASSNVDVIPGDSVAAAANFPLDLSSPNYQIYVRIDPDHEIQDFDRGNNVDSSVVYPTIFNVTPELGSTYSGGSSDTLSTDPVYKAFFPPGSVSQPTAVKVGLRKFSPPTDQPALSPVSIKNQSEYHGVEVILLNPAAQILTPFILQIDVGTDTTGGAPDFKDLKMYQRQSASQPWLYSQTVLDSLRGRIAARGMKSSLYAPFTSGDANAPRIELTVNGRPIQKRAQIQSKPVMYVVVEDESGLDLNKENIHVRINNETLPEDKVFIPDSTKRNNILGITIYPQFEAGEHRLEVQVSDVNGNTLNKEWELVVSDEFELHVFGNYPNPFEERTIFSYFVSPDVLDELEIRIYTVSGRLIKRITDDENTINDPRGFGARSVGYNELIWDGTDADGVKVANGVYFALIRAKFQDETREEILKVAKLR